MSSFPCGYPTHVVSPSTDSWGCCMAMMCLHTWEREATAAMCRSPLSARYLWSSISVIAEQLVLLISHFLGQCLNLPFHFLGAQWYSLFGGTHTSWSRAGPWWRRLCLHILPSISAMGEYAVYVTRVVLETPVWLVRSIRAIEMNSRSDYRLTDWCFALVHQHSWSWQHTRGVGGSLAETIIKFHTWMIKFSLNSWIVENYSFPSLSAPSCGILVLKFLQICWKHN